MVDAVDGGFEHLLEQLEVEQQPGGVERGSSQRHANAIVMAVRVLALAMVVAKVMAGRKAGFHGDFIHRRLRSSSGGECPSLILCLVGALADSPPQWPDMPRRFRRAAWRASSPRLSTCS